VSVGSFKICAAFADPDPERDGSRVGLSRRFDVAVIEADHIVLATGSTDWVPPGISVDGNIVMTSREALNASEAPNRLVVIGGGAVGIELAYVYAMYGTEVDLVEMEEQLLPGADREVAGALRRELRRKGLRIHLNTQYRELKIRDGEARVTVTSGGEESELRADRVLIAMGRRPLSDGLGLDDIGIDRDAHGFVCVDGNHRTRVPTISAIGDLAGGPLLAHKASEEGVAVAVLLAGLSRRRLEAHEIPTCIYSQPQVAWVGRTELQARALYGDDVRVGVFPFSASGRATAAGERAGFAKITAEPAYGEIVGAHVVGCGATELVAELSLAMRMEATAEDIAQVPHPHPTLSEAILEATLAAEGHALHL
jgi:dihydrolipoamide dehydrogenase